MTDAAGTHLTAPAAPLLPALPAWVTPVRADNPGPMTLDGTNTWLLRPGNGTVLVVDPGPDEAGHLHGLAGHGPVATVLVTHSHPDHVGGLAAFQAVAGPDLPVLARAAGLSGGPLAGVRVPDDGEVLRFGRMSCTVLVTPGHTADSVCFLVEMDGTRVLFTGDTILGRGSTVVAWPDGDLGDYLTSLDRLARLDGVPVLPGHGPALADTGTAARCYQEHRRERLDQVRAAVAAGAGTPGEITAMVYPDIDPRLVPAAQWSVRAQLAYLTSRGQR